MRRSRHVQWQSWSSSGKAVVVLHSHMNSGEVQKGSKVGLGHSIIWHQWYGMMVWHDGMARHGVAQEVR